MTRQISMLAIALAAALTGCATSPPPGSVARADIRAASGSKVTGTVMFFQEEDGVRVVAKISGLRPGEHGFHVHEAGDCSAPDAASAKGHFNPTASRHGHVMAEHHVGDLPNLRAEANGKAEYAERVEGLSLLNHEYGIVGHAIVVHADADDYISQPAGNSGKRIGCGVILVDTAGE